MNASQGVCNIKKAMTVGNTSNNVLHWRKVAISKLKSLKTQTCRTSNNHMHSTENLKKKMKRKEKDVDNTMMHHFLDSYKQLK